MKKKSRYSTIFFLFRQFFAFKLFETFFLVVVGAIELLPDIISPYELVSCLGHILYNIESIISYILFSCCSAVLFNAK